MKQRVGVMGGTFDPPHSGHQAIAHSFLKSSYIDKLLVLPTPVTPHKEDADLTPYRHRFKMAHLCFEQIPGIEVDDFECSLPSPHYTINTLQELSKQHPECEYKLCIGGDSLSSLKSWYNWRELVTNYDILVARRPDSEESVDIISDRIYSVDHQPHKASSTSIRACLEKGEIPEDLLCKGIPEYIRANHLYKIESC